MDKVEKWVAGLIGLLVVGLILLTINQIWGNKQEWEVAEMKGRVELMKVEQELIRTEIRDIKKCWSVLGKIPNCY